MTSVGKWTPRYILEKPTRMAKMRAGIPYCLGQQKNRIEATAKAAVVCPEGKE